MIDHGKKNLLGVLIDAVDYEAAVSKIISAAKESNSLTVAALAVHGVMTGVLDKVHRYRLNHLDLVVPDGQPVRWGVNLLHKTKLPDRVYGPTLALEVCRAAASQRLPIFLYGSQESVVKQLAINLRTKFAGIHIAGFQPSRFRKLTAKERDNTVDTIHRSGAAITFVGLGCPRQEVWAYEFGGSLSMPTIAVGAAFDFHAGFLKQAPESLQRAGLEWAFRLAMEPRRLWKRYFLLNPLYICSLVLQYSGVRKYDTSDVSEPATQELYG